MSTFDLFTTPTWTGSTWAGAKLGLLAALVYGLIFIIYAVLRSSFKILAILKPGEGLVGILAANAVSIFLTAAAFALLLGLLATVFQGLTLGLVHGLNTALNPAQAPLVGAGLGLLVSAVLAGGLLLLTHSSGGLTYAMLWRSGLVFWQVLPYLAFVGLNAWAGWALNAARSTQSL